MISDWSDPFPDRPIPLVSSIHDDLRAYLGLGAGKGRLKRLIQGFLLVASSSGFHLTWNYRLSHAIRLRWGLVGRPLVWLLYWWGRHFYGCSIAPTARIQGGLVLPHPQGIVIGPGAAIGPRAWIFQNVTIGGAPERQGLPQIGADARIYAGAVLTGPITIGDNVVIGANAVVHKDVPSRSIARSPCVDVIPLMGRFMVQHDG